MHPKIRNLKMFADFGERLILYRFPRVKREAKDWFSYYKMDLPTVRDYCLWLARMEVEIKADPEIQHIGYLEKIFDEFRDKRIP